VLLSAGITREASTAKAVANVTSTRGAALNTPIKNTGPSVDAVMKRDVFSLRKNFDIFRTVITPDFVLMVNMFALGQWSSNHSLCNKAMLTNAFVAIPNPNVPIAQLPLSSHRFPVAHMRTKLRIRTKPRRNDGEHVSAETTGYGSLFHLRRIQALPTAVLATAILDVGRTCQKRQAALETDTGNGTIVRHRILSSTLGRMRVSSRDRLNRDARHFAACNYTLTGAGARS
jgi:hypothetical protein